MPGDPTAFMADTFVGAAPSAPDKSRGRATGHLGFVAWVVILGVVFPLLILGGLKVGGFSFVFRHR